MGYLTIHPLAYDDIARFHGKDVAQRLWEKNGMKGKYVPGYLALSGYHISDCVVIGFEQHKADQKKLTEVIMSPVGNEAFEVGKLMMRAAS